ncbi:hypothetical protein OF83DRAFT_1056464 [Amylostereum chailletii]|nr:hypothetical protein OF83DRAFT_1056464 [Amylostereum chailletii]
MSIVSIPRTIADPWHDYFSSCLFYPGVKEHITALPLSPVPYDAGLCGGNVKIMDVLGAGRGIFAQRDFQAGELILRERPLLVIPKIFPPNTPYISWIQMTASALPDLQKTRLYALRNCKTQDPKDDSGIISTNALPIGTLPGFRIMHVAVHYLISHANHSCSPNACHSWDILSWTSGLRAARPIRAGEQITVTYTDVFAPAATRATQLRGWAFACTCPACALPASERKRSDARRAVLGSLASSTESMGAQDADIRAWARDAARADDHVVQKYLRFAGMMEEEALDEPGAWVAIARPLVKAYCALEDGGNAKRWAKKAMEMHMAASGKDGGWGTVLGRPEGSEWWGLRARGGAAA